MYRCEVSSTARMLASLRASAAVRSSTLASSCSRKLCSRWRTAAAERTRSMWAQERSVTSVSRASSQALQARGTRL